MKYQAAHRQRVIQAQAAVMARELLELVPEQLLLQPVPLLALSEIDLSVLNSASVAAVRKACHPREQRH